MGCHSRTTAALALLSEVNARRAAELRRGLSRHSGFTQCPANCLVNLPHEKGIDTSAQRTFAQQLFADGGDLIALRCGLMRQTTLLRRNRHVTIVVSGRRRENRHHHHISSYLISPVTRHHYRRTRLVWIIRLVWDLDVPHLAFFGIFGQL